MVPVCDWNHNQGPAHTRCPLKDEFVSKGFIVQSNLLLIHQVVSTKFERFSLATTSFKELKKIPCIVNLVRMIFLAT